MSQFTRLRPEVLSDHSTLEFTLDTLACHFDLCAHGYCCQTRDLWQIIVTAAARHSTIEATCSDFEAGPASSTVRSYLNTQLTPDQIPPVQAACNRALASQIPPWLWSAAQHKAVDIAIDLHDEPYYGRADLLQPEHWICRGEAKAGTTRFYRCATAYVIRRDVRVTLAVTFVHPSQHLVEVLQELLQRVRALGLEIRYLYLDKAFCGVAVLRYLKLQTTYAAIIAAPLRGHKSGTRTLCHGPRSYRSDYTFTSSLYGNITVPLGVVRTQAQRRDGSCQTQWLVYVLLRVGEPLPWVRQHYRLRFGIESSYRLMEQVRLKTTSNNAALRFLFMGMALVLGNIWIALQWRYLQVRGSGPRRIARQYFTLERMAHFLSRATEAVYGVVCCIRPPNVKPAIY